MEIEAKDSSQSPSGNRLKNVLSKTHRARKDNNDSAVSITVTDNSSDGTGSALRNSIDSLRLASRQSSLDDGKAAAKLSKLLPGRSKRKKKKQEAAERQQQEEEEGRGRDTVDQTATAAALGPEPGSGSRSPLDGDEGSSLMTVDSDVES